MNVPADALGFARFHALVLIVLELCSLVAASYDLCPIQ